jgi:hypothetical protein
MNENLFNLNLKVIRCNLFQGEFVDFLNFQINIRDNIYLQGHLNSSLEGQLDQVWFQPDVVVSRLRDVRQSFKLDTRRRHSESGLNRFIYSRSRLM